MKEERGKITLPGELLLVVGTFFVSMGVVFMLYSGAGISAVSSVGYALALVFPVLSQGTWTYLFQGLLVVILFIVGRRLNWVYLFSFVVGFFFGIGVDFHKLWVYALPLAPALRVVYFLLGYFSIAFGVALMNRCLLPIIPADLFSREFSKLSGIPFVRVKITLDVTCFFITLLLTTLCFGRPKGVGIGTAIAAFTLGKSISLIGERLDRRFTYRLFLKKTDQSNVQGA